MIDLDYIEPVFRPPSEWRSLILQVTNGCSWNHCTFCEMYQAPQKRFRFKQLDEIEQELIGLGSFLERVDRIFLADGDAMVLSERRLSGILQLIQKHVPHNRRVTAYCLPANVRNKSVASLKRLKDQGLSMVYVGCETGDDELLTLVDKGETFESSREALLKLHEAGIKSSVMILNGLGGRSKSQQHLEHSAQLINATQPHFLSSLVLSFPKGEQRYRARFPEYSPMTRTELLQELRDFIDLLDLDKTIFRSDHASNYLPLKGVLNKDKAMLIKQLNSALQAPEQTLFRPEHLRGL